VNRHAFGYAICALFCFVFGSALVGLIGFVLKWNLLYVLPLLPAWNFIKLSVDLAREALVEAGWRAPEKK
jgi:hypothetical protein